MFRLDRAEDLAIGEEPGVFERPDGFSVKDALLGMPWEAGPEHVDVRARFDPEVAWWALRQLPRTAEVTHEEDGAVIADLSVANPDAFIGWILGFDDRAEIVAPDEMRTALVALLRGAA